MRWIRGLDGRMRHHDIGPLVSYYFSLATLTRHQCYEGVQFDQTKFKTLNLFSKLYKQKKNNSFLIIFAQNFM